MEITYEESLAKIEKQLEQHPELAETARSLRNGAELRNIIAFENLDHSLLPIVEFEVLLVIALYTPLSELGQNISESAKIPIKTAHHLAQLIESIILDSIATALRAYDLEIRSDDAPLFPEASLETKERLDLRPRTPANPPGSTQTGAPPKPLTREELMNALGGKRTMAQDIETLRMKQGGED